MVELIILAQDGDNSATELLIEQNSGLIWSIVHRFTGRGVDIDDLYQLGSLGLLKAIKGFDTEFGTQFSTYAVPKISGEIRRFFRDDSIIKVSRSTKDLGYKIYKARTELEKSLGREPHISEIAALAEVSVEEIAMCDTALSSVSSLQQSITDDGDALENFLGTEGIEDKIIDNLSLSSAMDTLTDKDKMLITLRFFKGLTQQQTAKILDMSQVQVSRNEKKILTDLRKFLSKG